MKNALIASLLLLSVIWIAVICRQSHSTAQEPNFSKQDIPVPDEAAIERRDFMRTKLLYSQNVFEGLTVRDFTMLRRGIKELEQLLEAEQWVTIDNEQYQQLTREFKTSLKRLKTTSESRNIEATALRFYEMSNRCIDCHQHLRRAKYEF